MISERHERSLSVRTTRVRYLAFAVTAVVMACGASTLALLAVDVHLHSKYERGAGFNVWGYRGPTVARKRPDEYRVVLLGGSSAFGYGVDWQESIAPVLESRLAGHEAGGFKHFSAVDLGYNNEGAYSFKYTLADYQSLHYDLALLYEGYNDTMADPTNPNVAVFRHDSPVFRLTGYLPIFPIVFREKAASMLYGNTKDLYSFEGKTVFHNGVGTRTAAESLKMAAEVGDSLSRQLDRVTAEPPRKITDVAATGCKSPWQEYCRNVLVAVEYALAHDTQVMFVTQPYELESVGRRHRAQQAEASALVQRRFGGDPRFRYLNLGSSVDLADRSLSFDRMHLTAEGNRRVAANLVQPVLDMAVERRAPAK
jgi:hypothetical protein